MVPTLVFEAWINLREDPWEPFRKRIPEIKPDKILQLTLDPVYDPNSRNF